MNVATMVTFWAKTAAIFSVVSVSTFFRSMALFSICFRLIEQGEQITVQFQFHPHEPKCQRSSHVCPTMKIEAMLKQC